MSWVGRPVPRREDARFLAGRGRFVADLAEPGTVHAMFVRSTQPSARLLKVEVEEARRQAGVVAVYTGTDLAESAAPLPTLHQPHPGFAAATEFRMADAALPCLATEAVHYVGQPLAVVVARTRHLAEDAAELVDVRYEDLPAVTDAAAALADSAPVVHEHLPSNEAGRIAFALGDVAAARAGAHLVVTGTYRMGRHGAVPLECRGVFAAVDHRRDRVEVWTSTQIPHLVREALCAVTGWPRDGVRVAAPDVGGGFGTKANVYPEEIVIPLLARRLERPVSWVEDRAEHFVAAAHGRDQVHHTRLAVDATGHILGWEDDFVVDVGAASLWTAGILANTAVHLHGPYRMPAMRVSGRAAFTNKTVVAQYRGAGRPEACFALERALDAAAAHLGIGAEEIRRRNLLSAAELPYPVDLPYRDGVPIEFDGGDYLGCFEACLDALPRAELAELRAAHPELAIGYGVANYLEATGRGPYETGRVRLTSAGRFEVFAGSASAGQGHQTTLAQVAADALGVDPSRITVVNGDTDAVPDGIGTFASRSAVLAGNAVHQACLELVARALELSGSAVSLDRAELVGSAAWVDWAELARALAPRGRLGDAQPLDVTARYRPPTVTWTMGTHAAIVGVDRETGLCTVLRYAVAHEGGVEINPLIVHGQIVGGVAQGVGGALLEEFRYSADGQPLTGSLADYLVPETTDLPEVRVVARHARTDRNPLGVRGAGESGTIAAYPAVAAAVQDAIGAHLTSTPITPGQLWRAARAPEPVLAR
ncbi:MAG TPA: xanthine dehydrogenase family protein molybdopterin-binding subunit [Pseudonocardia sp.]|uniref:xanthine dehydrogenase family protein molybdopterin-binding subunit n=1 Tax=Pseudonocardia sp. TaxID=60912 RepID=UPI002D166C7E|nr:xanthine dehydrogenase family protein molybdopterin-binding subunit [Pseudonocardia sp.]HTF46678.1 xanthine dehydrogenase family protein molybdopterin-binding subunit [Pseudonocardia sp.]